MIDKKICRYCERELPFAAFHKRNVSPDGLSYKCKECQSAYRKERYLSVPEARASQLAKMKEWAARNADRSREIKRRYEEKNPDFHRERKRIAAIESRRRNPDRARALGRAAAIIRRQREVGSGAVVLARLSSRMIEKAKGACVYCGEHSNKLTIDHFNAVSNGGGGQWWNIVPCCQSCNSSKKDKDGPAWIERKFGIDRLVEVFHRLNYLSSARLP